MKKINLLFIFLSASVCGSAQTISVMEKSVTVTASNVREKAFADFVEKENVRKGAGADSIMRSRLAIMQKNISITTSLPAGYDTIQTWQVKLDVGLTQKGTECFSDKFVLNKYTPVKEGAAFYIKNGLLNYEVTINAVRDYPAYVTVSFTSPGGQVLMQESTVDIKE